MGVPQIFRDLHKKFSKDVWFGIVDQAQMDMRERFQVGKIPSLYASKCTGVKPLLYDGKLAVEDIKAWVKEWVKGLKEGGTE